MIVSLEEALAAGSTRYFTGKPCKHGHVAERLVSNRSCCECLKLAKRRAYHANPGKHKEAGRRWQLKNKEKRREISRRYYYAHHKENRARLNAHTKRYRKADPEKYIRLAREHHHRHREKQLDRMRKYRKMNPDIVRASTHAWRSRNKDKVSQQKRNRYAREKGADGGHTLRDIAHLYRRQREECAGCGTALNGIFEVDHIIPLSRGGNNFVGNIQLLCKSCNASKGAKLMIEWRGK
jgi:5-methylcytosine-specific restriction endonuclease McrA